MAQQFLDIVKKTLGDSDYAGDQHGGATGSDGSGLPDSYAGNFLFATGIECSYPTIAGPKGTSIRRDQLDECGHYKHWKRDLELVRELGLKVLRYGLPYHSIQQSADKYDWEFADLVMAQMKKLDITPILDLCHFGVPDFVENFQNPEFPTLFARYAEEVAKRHPHVRYYTPVNEIFVTAKFSGKEGVWNERLKTDLGFVTALKHCVAASILGNHAIARNRPDCVIVQSESAEYIHEAKASLSSEIKLQNKLRFLALDLLYAHPPDADVCIYSASCG
jgi:beta-glucosidase/6-phospho-beta-glucosidase/beta-galactosidase